MSENNSYPMKYVRIQGRENAYRTGKPVGIFAAVGRLERANLLTDEEKAAYHEITSIWFEENLPNPPFYNDDEPGKPITWFKTETAGFMVAKLVPLMEMLEKYATPYDIVYSNFPGRIVYEDEWQVAVYDDNAPGRIVCLSPEHLPIYAEVIRKSFATVADALALTPENCRYHPAFITNERLAEKFRPGYYPLGYFAGGILVGFASLTDEGNGIFAMNDVTVLPEYRRAGYGKELVDFCKRETVALGGNKIEIEVVHENLGLQEWYAAQGFTYTRAKIYPHLTITFGYMEWSVK